MTRYRVFVAVALVAGLLLAYFVWSTQADPTSRYRFKLGLDLAGGTELVYKADMSETPTGERSDALSALQGVIERRVNLFGVAEPIVQTEQASALSGITEDRLIVDLPGVTDIKAAVAALGETPTLEFKLAVTTKTGLPAQAGTTTQLGYVSTGLTGRYLASASLQFGSGATAGLAAPQVLLNFDSDGAKLFEKITSEHVGETLAIFLDGVPISTPTIQEAIPGGQATITGNFTATEARDLVRNLNFGALPVPITLQNSSAVGPTLGAAAISAGVVAGVVGFVIVALFMIAWYRLPGVIAAIALAEYLAFMLAVIKVIPVTLTASGIAGLIISVGMAVDANVLIFERTKEELRGGKTPREAVHIGFSRAWPAIRDGHLTMIISGIILFWLGTSIVQGFALVFVLGVLASFISAVSLSRVFLLAIVPEEGQGAWKFLLGSGFRSPVN
ncbi:protein-export membrane protein SecD [Candidatus Kaiserbacteria bacterium RIFCSPHIGHO2_02_FULL_54_22]|uniref:Protein translocase subunit SecD n=1 Tax=Candidatus Kaiserbacteria bacterium RIFCSPHIGHO2_02_FULL_54_22 TaxID=1798495 RepID=A0A1F6DJS7_9BACT|nr:MAG: protein-export membrane protein SecD [Candidatus Kaiserbacteria bacterium RIFCSPHIGHO2_02_FULL_54_22]OGG67820.1 MAG: protein-export membrane protein SecD [Candidatus Kaiserbacteria bacterium RIFCSPHIGHO2_12_FULL_54_16]OGG90452.1 MAG: protein-export membrane protein SecD [Candidatus Kaiserbacteria bacterium RIFCSPLOWO2_12_FULL_54_10]